ncbi:hypothetical protein E3N88_13611 [Mikania micrantha]|uniref:Uncharacterized protein n=1 Tax=Mikania micrantha TaxID=192012 RepID=A0A5N6PAS2_9ASTR|nr:hypothetical protein E3N88_13611 [Mikania micrantha]
MDHVKKQSGGSSFTENLFGPKDASSSSSSSSASSSLFSSVFGPSSTGLGRDASHSKNTGSSSKTQEFGGSYGSGKSSTPDCRAQRSMGVKDGNSIYQNETAEPSYLSSSIYYGGQEVYSPNTETTRPRHTFKKDEGDNDPNGSSASRGNWWQGKNVMGLLDPSTTKWHVFLFMDEDRR